MSPPIYTPDGTEVSEIVLPDGSTASEVIGPDGNVVFEAGPDIPDSVEYQWKTPISGLSGGDTVSTWPDSVGSADGSGTGVTYDAGGFVTSDAVSGDGNDDYVVTQTLPELTDAAWTWAFTYKSTESNRAIMGQDEDSNNFVRWDINNVASGPAEFRLGNGASIATTAAGSTDVHDGNEYVIVFVKPSDTPSDWEIYVGDANNSPTQEEITLSNAGNGGFGSLTSFSFTADFTIFDRSQQDFGIDADIGWMEIATEAWTQSEVDGFYDRQPWT